MRDLSEEEIEWLEEYPPGQSHGVQGSQNLAACSDCDWVAQAESFEFLMSQVTDHLKDTFEWMGPIELELRKGNFRSTFGWDPWAEGVITVEDEQNPFDILTVTERDEDGDVVDEIEYLKELGEDEL